MFQRKYRKAQNFFSCNRKRNKKTDKDGNENLTTVSYKIKFVNRARFMASSSSNLVDNLAEGIHKTNCEDCNCFAFCFLLLLFFLNTKT